MSSCAGRKPQIQGQSIANLSQLRVTMCAGYADKHRKQSATEGRIPPYGSCAVRACHSMALRVCRQLLGGGKHAVVCKGLLDTLARTACLLDVLLELGSRFCFLLSEGSASSSDTLVCQWERTRTQTKQLVTMSLPHDTKRGTRRCWYWQDHAQGDIPEDCGKRLLPVVSLSHMTMTGKLHSLLHLSLTCTWEPRAGQWGSLCFCRMTVVASRDCHGKQSQYERALCHQVSYKQLPAMLHPPSAACVTVHACTPVASADNVMVCIQSRTLSSRTLPPCRQ